MCYNWRVVRTSFVHIHALGQRLDNAELSLSESEGALLPFIGDS